MISVEIEAELDSFERDRELSLTAARVACASLRLELACEEKELAAIDREFSESLSYRIGSKLCPNSRL